MHQKFTICIEPETFDDIQSSVDYYNFQKSGLGIKFYNTVNNHFNFLQTNYFLFSKRYKNIRCMPVKGFPHLILYEVIQNQKP